MSIEKNKNEIIAHISSALEQMRVFLIDLANNAETKIKKKADLISYWIEDWLRYLIYENDYRSKLHPVFKRGSIVQVNFGFNVGTELGGRHYAITLDYNDDPKIPDIVVIPLTSIKEDTNIKKLNRDKSRINLKDYIYKIIITKYLSETNELVNDVTKYINNIKNSNDREYIPNNDLSEKTTLIEKHSKELEKIKKGTIAHIRQIRSISKMRIVSPTKGNDLLNNLKVSKNILNEIDKRIHNLYVGDFKQL